MQVSFKFCPKCEKDLANNKEMKVRMKPAGRRICLLKNLKKRKRNNGPRLFGNNIIIISCVARIHFCLLRLALFSISPSNKV